MAPPHTSRKKISSTTSQVTSRCGSRRFHQEHVEKDKEEIVEDHEEADVMDMDDAEADNDAITESRPNAPLGELMVNIIDTQRKRQTSRKQSVRKAYDEAHTKTKEAITSHFDNHEARAAQMARLEVLLKKKAVIEAAMAEKLADLRKEYVYHSKALQMVVEHHLKQLH
ncbi:hypothetical protein N0V90_003250 [Kalmusia sp. IMI 367209]|nr:hypothetical protein N0V90_003250 [Kalmusia sp. IMI 367209]